MRAPGLHRIGSGSGDGWELTPLRIAAVYLVFGFVALLVSDLVLLWYLSDPLLTRVQALKGGVEVLLTGALVFGLTDRSRAQLASVNTSLDRHREELRVLHRVLRHNIRNDLNAVEGYLELARSRADSAETERLCDRATEECEELIRYAERTSDIRKISASEEPRGTVDAVEVVSGVLDDHELVDEGETVRTDLPEAAPVRVNRMFERAIEELLTNAVVHADGSPTVGVSVVSDATPDGLTRVEVTDDGPGLPAHVRELFAGSPDAADDQLVHLDGLGLWFVYLTVVASGGEFDVETGEDGTTVRLWVPAATDDGRTLPGTTGLVPATRVRT